MNNKPKYFYLYFFLIILGGCISPYYPTVTKYEYILVVDGQLTNLAGPYKVKLSRSFTYTQRTGTPVSNATIKIIDNSGLEVQLKEDSYNIGEYYTVDSTFRGVEGKSYKLQIKIDGLMYESSFEMLKKPIPIDKFYWEYKPQGTYSPKGVQLYVDTHDPENNTRYYLWDFEETWRFRVPIYVTKNPEWIECYQSNPSKTFNINTTIQTHNDIIDRQPLFFINESTNRLYYRYTIKAKQYVLTREAYTFFEELVKFNMNQGSLFDPIPYSLVGNMKCVTNKDIPVIGYFLVSGASEKRIFIDRSELPTDFNPISGFEDCYSETVTVSTGLSTYRQNPVVDSLMNKGFQIYETFDPHVSGFIGLSLAKPRCYNCTILGDNKVPDFWIEK